MSHPAPVRSGLEVLGQQAYAPLRGLRIGLLSHPAAVDRQLRSADELLRQAPGVHLAALFGPEHGFFGTAQDLIPVNDEQPDLRIHSLYGPTVVSLQPTEEQLHGLDALVIDLQDVGSRYYTFQTTMLLCLEAASRHNLLTVVLDRPNPLGGVAVEGPTLQAGFESFVGLHPIASRHGMTMGELARLYQAERHLTGELRIIPCEGWQREMDFEQTGLPWVLPSPNMPTVATAFVYPGQCLLEGTNLSEGRGTTRPFELCGAPWLDATVLVEQLRQQSLPGVAFRPAWFQPTFHKYAGQLCQGVQLHVQDREAFQPVRTSLALLQLLIQEPAAQARDGLPLLALRANKARGHFDWRREPYELVADRLAIDLLFGSDRERLALEAGRSWVESAHAWEAEEQAFRQRRQQFLIY